MPVVLSLAVLAGACCLPGFALLPYLPGLPDDRLLRFALVTGLGLAVALVLTLAAMLLGLTVWTLTWILLAGTLLSVLLCFRSGRQAHKTPEPFSNPVSWLALGSVAFLILCGWYQQGTFSLTGDGPELVASLRESVTTGKLFPTDTHFLGAGLAGADIRKGLLHPLFASCLRLSGDHLLDSWLHMPILFAVFPFLSAYGLMRLSGLKRASSLLGAWLLVLTMNGGLSARYAPLSANPKVVATCLFWLSCGLMFFSARHASRHIALLAGLVGVAAGLAHPMVVVFLAAFYGIHLLWVLLVSREPRSLLLSGMVVLVGLVPYYVIRYQTYDPQNPLHLELQGMLFLGNLRIYSPLQWLEVAGWLAVPTYVGFLGVKWRRWKRPVDWWGWWAILTCLMLAFNPAMVPTAQKYITYLVFRLPWMFPAALAVPVLLSGIGPSMKRTGLLILMGVSLLPVLTPFLRGEVLPRSRSTYGDMVRHQSAFDSLNVILPSRSVLVADPTTSYLLPALTDNKVICSFDQHATPNDGRAIERISVARSILSPVLSDSVAWSLAKQEGAAYVLFWKESISVLSLYWQVDRESAAQRIAQFHKSPYFVRIASPEAFTLFALADHAPIEATASESPDHVPLPLPPEESPLIDAYGLRTWTSGVPADYLSVGDTLRIPFSWQRTQSYAPAPLALIVRLTSVELPGGNVLGGKLWRKALEIIRGEAYQTRAEAAPGGGKAPPIIWPSDSVLRQTIQLPLPRNLRPGTYALQARVNRTLTMRNYDVSDLLYNTDTYSGVVFDTVRVGP